MCRYCIDYGDMIHVVCVIRYYLLRDVYDDMMLDGVQPSRDVFHSLIVGTMKGSRLQDAFFFRDQMKTTGLLPDVWPFMVLSYFIFSSSLIAFSFFFNELRHISSFYRFYSILFQ